MKKSSGSRAPGCCANPQQPGRALSKPGQIPGNRQTVLRNMKNIGQFLTPPICPDENQGFKYINAFRGKPGKPGNSRQKESCRLFRVHVCIQTCKQSFFQVQTRGRPRQIFISVIFRDYGYCLHIPLWKYFSFRYKHRSIRLSR